MAHARVVLMLLVSGCGYRFVAPGGALPGDLRAVRAPVFENRTAEPTAELWFTEAFRDQLQRAGVLGGDAAEGVVDGVVESIAGYPVLVPVASKPGEPPRLPAYRLSAAVRLTLSKEGRVLATTTVGGTEDYPSGADVLLTEANRSAALRRLAEQLMREGYERLASN